MFGGVLIDSKTLPTSAQLFDTQLAGALSAWKTAGKKGACVCLYVCVSVCVYVCVLYVYGYEYVFYVCVLYANTHIYTLPFLRGELLA